MSEPEGYYRVGLSREAVYVRVVGLASMFNAACVRDFVEHMIEKGYAQVVFDLEDCAGMDSTFLGVIAGVATWDRGLKPPAVTIVNASQNNAQLIEGVGLNELVEMCAGRVEPPGVRLETLQERTREDERLELLRVAHEKLIAIDERNEEAFGHFLRALQAEIERRRGH